MVSPSQPLFLEQVSGNKVQFEYEVQQDDHDPDGLVATDSAIRRNGGVVTRAEVHAKAAMAVRARVFNTYLHNDATGAYRVKLSERARVWLSLMTAASSTRRCRRGARQRAALFYLPTDEAALLGHYTLSDDDIEQIRVRRGGHNRQGFALQPCAFRYRPDKPQSELNPVLPAAQGRATVEKPAPLEVVLQTLQ